MIVAVGVTLGLLIVILAIGVPYWLTHRHMRPQHDPAEMQAYLDATDRSAEKIAAGAPSRGFDSGSRAAERSSCRAGSGNRRART